MRRIKLLVLLLSTALTTVHAQPAAWRLDKAHSSVTFTVKHMVISEVTGKFRDFDISVTSSKDDFTDAVVEATIKVASITTDNDRRDNHLRSDDFFNAEKFPEIKFKSHSVEELGKNVYKIHGDLTIRDTTKKVTLGAVHNGTISTAQGTRAGWKAMLSVNRFDYGLKWNRTIETGGLIAGDTVNIILNFELLK